MPVKRTLAGLLGALALALPAAVAPVVAMPAHAVGPALLPVTVTNSTGRGDAVHLYVIGVNLATGRLGYVNAAGAFTAWSGGTIPPSAAPDVSIGGPGNGASTTLRFPRGFSGRVYFSFGEKLKFFLTPDGLVQPAPWAAGDPNQNILFDWSEFTYNDAGLWLNSSQVDMFAVPHAVTVTGAGGVTSRTGDPVADGRNAVINAIKAQPGWAGTVATRSDGTVLRVLSPGKAAGAGLLSGSYLDPYITSAWNAYTGKTLTVVPFADQPNTRYFGRTSGNVMTFTNGSGAVVASFSKPSSADVWGCAGNLPAPNDLVVGPISRTLCAALNRGTLGTVDTQPDLNASGFYRNSPTNQYARIIHANMADGRAYAFAFDDVGHFESLVTDADPRSASITLSPFAGGGTTPPGGRALVNANGLCLDDRSSGTANGNPVQIYTCNATAAQQWTFVEAGSTLHVLGKCLDITGGGTANGTKLQLWDCNNTGAQVFVPQAGGAYYNPQSNRCLDDPGGSSTPGTQVQIWDCNGSGAQRWTLTG